jgi:ribosomal protein L35
MSKFLATATWKVKRAHTSLTRHILVEADSKEEATLRARAELSSFITRNKAVLQVQEVE